MDRREFLESVAGVFMLTPASATTKPELVSNRFRRTVARADTPNGNKRVYSRALLERIVADFDRENRNQRTMLGQLGMNEDTSLVRLSLASHLVTDMRMDGDYLSVEIEVLATPMGAILYGALKNQDVEFRTAGVGAGHTDADGNFVIDDSYKLVSINAVEAAKATPIY